jgi:hypothetical protein
MLAAFRRPLTMSEEKKPAVRSRLEHFLTTVPILASLKPQQLTALAVSPPRVARPWWFSMPFE